MKQIITLVTALMLMFAPILVKAVDLDDVTMQTMDARDEHASDITNDIELPGHDVEKDDDKKDDNSAKSEDHEDDRDDDKEDDKDDSKDDDHHEDEHDAEPSND